MDILVAGGHGQVALRLLKLLAAQGHTARGLIRDPDQAADLRAAGAIPVIGDLENDVVAGRVRQGRRRRGLRGRGRSGQRGRPQADGRPGRCGQAGRRGDGRGRTPLRHGLVDRRAGPAAGGAMQPYLEAKAEADAYVVASGLDYTIVRPGGLTDEPGTGRVTVTRDAGQPGPVPRDDVAAVLAACLSHPGHHRRDLRAVRRRHPDRRGAGF